MISLTNTALYTIQIISTQCKYVTTKFDANSICTICLKKFTNIKYRLKYNTTENDTKLWNQIKRKRIQIVKNTM